MKEKSKNAERRAQAILRGEYAPLEEILKLVASLQINEKFGLARKLLEGIIHSNEVTAYPKLRITVGHKLALSTYKDPQLPTGEKLERALAILQSCDDLAHTVNQETLGLAGAIKKKMWEYHGSERHHLETAGAYYLRGYQQGVTSDFGYTGINAAFVLDTLADLEFPEEQIDYIESGSAAQPSRQAREIRQMIVDMLPSLPDASGKAWLRESWWFLVTVGEAFFGLHDYENASIWLQRAAALPNIADWERESTARHLAKLLNLMERHSAHAGQPADSRAREVLRNFLGISEATLLSLLGGKIGLAMSGGGFRASLYHVGVLARLAELDLLRRVECLSCVSGGSIVGAHYYLEVRNLLASKRDEEITRDDYIEIVNRLQHDLLAGIQSNIRTRVTGNMLTSIKMIFLQNYSRIKRVGELFERKIFSRVADSEGARPRYLNELQIIPLGESQDFSPRKQNWRRSAKAPLLILNATSLNTGHNWQFTTSWMGESPAGTYWEGETNYRFRRMYYPEAPPPNNKMRLGYAVAASACMPGMFEPLPIPNLYPGLSARLVDGGIHDNHGTSALLEQECSVLLVSDGSGQLGHVDSPTDGVRNVQHRASNILLSCARVSQADDLESRWRSGALKGLMFVHLKKDLETRPLDWIGSESPSIPAPDSAQTITKYGIQKGIQRRLASIRSDLDSLSDVEAYALMTSGYLSTAMELKDHVLGFDVVEEEPRSEWPFLVIEPLLAQPSPPKPLVKWLNRQRFLRTQPQLAAGLSIVFLASMWTIGDLLWFGALLAISLSGFWLISRLVNYRKTLREILLGVGMMTFGWLAAIYHLYIFDPLYLKKGTLASMLRRTQTEAMQERIRVVEERKKSIRRAGEKVGKPSYAVQQSKGFMLFAKRNLDPVTEAKVTKAIFELSDNPYPSGAQTDPETQHRLLRIPETEWRIAYDVDEPLQRIRIYHLTRETPQASAST